MKKYIFLSILISSYYIGIIHPVYALTFTANQTPELIITDCENGDNDVALFDEAKNEIENIQCDFDLPYSSIEQELDIASYIPFTMELIEYTGNAGCDTYEDKIGETCLVSQQFFNFTGESPATSILSVGSPNDIMALVGTLFSDLWLILSLVIGIPLAFYIIQYIIKLFPKDKKISKIEKEYKPKKDKNIIYEYETDIHGHKQIKGGHY